MAEVTYAQLSEATDVQETDLLASFRGTGPLKRLVVSTLLSFLGGKFLPLTGGTMTGQLVADVGTEASPGIAFDGMNDGGLFAEVGAKLTGLSSSGVRMAWVDPDGFNLGRGINYAAFKDVASAATTPIGDVQSTYARVTGSTGPITSLGSADEGVMRIVLFASTPTLTYNASSLILPGAANITAAAGDMAKFISLGSSNWRCEWYSRANGNPLNVGTSGSKVPLLDGNNTASGNNRFTGKFGVGAGVVKTIAANSITYTSAFLAATSGTLNTITGASAGDLLFLSGGSGGGTTTVAVTTSGAANTIYAVGSNYTLNGGGDLLFLIFNGTFWWPICYIDNGP